MTSHYVKFQLDSSKRSQVIPLQKNIDNDDDDIHPGWIIVRDIVFRRGQKHLQLRL